MPASAIPRSTLINRWLDITDIERVWKLAGLGGAFDTAYPESWMWQRINLQKQTGCRALSPVGHVWWYPGEDSPKPRGFIGRPLRWTAVFRIARKNLAQLRTAAGIDRPDPLAADLAATLRK